jgi:hypothetical protein
MKAKTICWPKVVEWSGAGLGLLGSYLVACKSDISGYGFVAYLISNLFWLVFGIRSRAWGLVTMQLGFGATSVIGIYNWFLPALHIMSGT